MKTAIWKSLCARLASLFLLLTSSLADAQSLKFVSIELDKNPGVLESGSILSFENVPGSQFAVPIPESIQGQDLVAGIFKGDVDVVAASKTYRYFVGREPILTGWRSSARPEFVLLKSRGLAGQKSVLFAIRPDGQLFKNTLSDDSGIRVNEDIKGLRKTPLRFGQDFYTALKNSKLSRVPLFSEEALSIANVLIPPPRNPFEIRFNENGTEAIITVLEKIADADALSIVVGVRVEEPRPGKEGKTPLFVRGVRIELQAEQAKPNPPAVTPTPKATPSAPPSAMPTSPGTTSPTPGSSATPEPSVSPVTSPSATSSPLPTATQTPVSTATPIGTKPPPTATATPVPSATARPLPTAKPTSTATSTPQPTVKPTSTPISTPTSTPIATPTSIPTATPTAQPTATPTAEPETPKENVLTDNLVAYYPFDDGSAKDATGNGHHGTITGGSTKVLGKVGSALRFDSTGSASFPVPPGSAFDFKGDFSISYWIRPENHGPNRTYLSRPDNWALGTNNVGSGNSLTFGVGGVYALASGYWDDEYYHAVLVYSAATKTGTFYKNTLPSSGTLGSLAGKPGNIRLNGSKGHYDTTYDDLRFYSRALTKADVRKLYDFGLSNGAGALHTLNVSQGGSGAGSITGQNISCGGDCFEVLPTNAQVTLQAQAKAGSSFTGWRGGACSGTSSCTLTIKADTDVVAEFTAVGKAPGEEEYGSRTRTVKKTGGDFASVQACAAAVLPGETCLISGGTYSETLSPTVSGTFSKPIRFKAVPGEVVKINQVNSDAVDFVRFEGLLVKNVQQWGIEYIFNDFYEIGLFANEDFWVKGPVTINAMTPDFNGTNHGWEVNPVFEGPQGFDKRAGRFKESIIPQLPYVAKAGESIVKSISRKTELAVCTPTNRPCLQTAGVLTVLANRPVHYGATLFRPPYVGLQKANYSARDLKTDLLPKFAKVANTSALQSVKRNYERVQLDHKDSETGRVIHPYENMGDYGGDNAVSTNMTSLRMMLDDTVEEKMVVLLPYIQAGIDLYHQYLHGQKWQNMGGHSPGRRVTIAFAATLLDHPGIRDLGSRERFFNEDRMISRSTNGLVLYGGVAKNESGYWGGVRSAGASGDRGVSDPYRFVDGGPAPTTFYQSVLAQPYKGAALAATLMPSLQGAWNKDEYKELIDYSDRWVNHGGWSQPDPCAPLDQGGGPDGIGGCVLDPDLVQGSTMTSFSCQPGKLCGRFPEKHGTKKDTGVYGSSFVTSMWKAYRETVK